jgi:phospholipid transport system substrate-binding protein
VKHSKQHLTRAIAWAGLVAIVGLTAAAEAASPTDRVREYTEAVIRVLEDPSLSQPARRHERRAAVRRVAAQIFDLEETARRALGVHWQARTPAEREEFVRAFADLLERTYIARIDRYGGERVRITGETIEGDRALVRGRVATKTGRDVEVEARMLRKQDQWFIYDVAVENVGLVANYRSQFDRIIRTSSYAELMRRLKDLNETLERNEPPPERRS